MQPDYIMGFDRAGRELFCSPAPGRSGPGRIWASFDSIRYRVKVYIKPLPVVATVLCGCGRVHSFGEWQRCPGWSLQKPMPRYWGE